MSCSKESSNMAVEKNPRVTMNFYQKTMSSSYHIKNIMRIIHRGNLYQYICTGEKAFRCCYFWKFTGFSDNVNPANIRLDEDEYVCLSLTSSEDVLVKTKIFALAIRLQDVFKTPLRRFQDVFKTSCKSVFKTSSKTSCKDMFKTFPRRIIKLNCSC